MQIFKSKLYKGDVKMENIRKMNVLVLGNSGAGKSTLIKAISGAEVKTLSAQA